jgi:signal transduction histidine kinase
MGQRLASMAIGLSGLRRRMPDSAVGLREEVVSLQREVSRLSTDVRQVSHDLHPGVLQQFGLVEAVRLRGEELRNRNGIDVVCEFAEDWPVLPDAVTVCVYRVAQEAMLNVAKHASARCVHVKLEYRGGLVTLSLRDDGRGFDQATRRYGLGLVSLEERVRMLGGSLHVQSSPTGGTLVTATVPDGLNVTVAP